MELLLTVLLILLRSLVVDLSALSAALSAALTAPSTSLPVLSRSTLASFPCAAVRLSTLNCSHAVSSAPHSSSTMSWSFPKSAPCSSSRLAIVRSNRPMPSPLQEWEGVRPLVSQDVVGMEA